MQSKKILGKVLKEKVKGAKSKTLNILATAYAVGMCSVGYVLPVYASNPMSNARNVVNEWLQPLFFIGIGVFGVLLLLKRKFTEFFSYNRKVRRMANP